MRSSLYVIRHPAPANVDPGVHQLILTAIHGKRVLRFNYHDKERIVEPQDYGIQKGIAHLFTFQPQVKAAAVVCRTGASLPFSACLALNCWMTPFPVAGLFRLKNIKSGTSSLPE
jgi:hypothetical protein